MVDYDRLSNWLLKPWQKLQPLYNNVSMPFRKNMPMPTSLTNNNKIKLRLLIRN